MPYVFLNVRWNSFEQPIKIRHAKETKSKKEKRAYQSSAFHETLISTTLQKDLWAFRGCQSLQCRSIYRPYFYFLRMRGCLASLPQAWKWKEQQEKPTILTLTMIDISLEKRLMPKLLFYFPWLLEKLTTSKSHHIAMLPGKSKRRNWHTVAHICSQENKNLQSIF